MKKRAFIYCRVSTREQANEGYSIREQEERLKAYAKSRDYTVVKSYVDAGHSGASVNRPALQELIKNINSVDVVIVYKLDRLSRSQKDTLYLIEDIFLKNNIAFISLNESFDTSTPFGRAMIGILSVFAQLEREQIAERMMMGKVARAKDGYWHGAGGENQVLTGYDYIDGELIINEYEAEFVRYIFDEYLKGSGIETVHKKADEKFPGIVAHATAVGRLLSTPTYTGVIHYQGEIYKGRHEAIISSETFDKVQELRKKKTSRSNPFKREYLLSGLLFCGHCNARISGRSGSKLKDGTTLKYYSCYTRRGTPKCMMTAQSCIKTNENKDRLEESIINEIKNIDINTIKSKNKSGENRQKKIDVLNKQLNNIDNQISKTVDLFSVGNIPIKLLTSKVDKLNEDREKILNHIKELKDDSQVNLVEIKNTLSQLSDFDNQENDTKRLIVAKLINKITVYNDDITIDWAF